MLLAMPLYVPVTALLVFACSRVSTWSVVLFLFPAFVAQKLFVLYQEQRATAEELSAAMLRQEKAHLSFASALVATLDARDEYTAGHSAAVAIYARDIAERLGLSRGGTAKGASCVAWFTTLGRSDFQRAFSKRQDL